MYSSLITPQIVNEHLEVHDWRFLDCRFELTEPEKKLTEFLDSHLPGALYAHLNHDLAVPHIPGKTGRHPLPEKEKLKNLFSSWGIDGSVQVVVYDDCGGAYAVRLWWMLRWLGHDAVALMDGGWPRWIKEGRPVTAELFVPQEKNFKADPRQSWLATAEDIQNNFDNPDVCILDARNSDRFHGKNETIDPVAGHIPGALSAPFADNLDADGNWKPKADLRRRFENLLADSPVEKTVSYCGSGITACHNILAMYHAGLGDSRLYCGSWSDWIADPKRPVA
ncbi:MAG: sulfurtransferase [SAR324 cluster bacterium]|nr:sulfurtransferase [SAR324 cluster bacterium]MBL7034665.1 sulfurtransferase [SAR324 cluster bacterium]